MEQREDGLYGPDPNEFFCGSPYDDELLDAMHRRLREHFERAAGDTFAFVNETGTFHRRVVQKVH